MTRIRVECWNCGLIFSVSLDRLATARCGNCQQMVTQNEAEAAVPTPTISRPEREEPLAVTSVQHLTEEPPVEPLWSAERLAETAPAAPPSPRRISAPDWLWATGRSLLIWLCIYPAAIGMLAYLRATEGNRISYFVRNFEFYNPDPVLSFSRFIGVLLLFFHLSLTQKATRRGRYLIAVSAALLVYIFQLYVEFRTYFNGFPADYFFQFVMNSKWGLTAVLLITLSSLRAMEWVIQRRFQLQGNPDKVSAAALLAAPRIRQTPWAVSFLKYLAIYGVCFLGGMAAFLFILSLGLPGIFLFILLSPFLKEIYELVGDAARSASKDKK